MPDYPDFNATALLKGFYAGEPKGLTLDANGYMIAMLNALYGGLPKNLQADVDGNIQINLNAQGLSELINRNKYGTATRGSTVRVCTGAATTDLFAVYGKGVCYGALIYTNDADVNVLDSMTFKLDGNSVSWYSWDTMKKYGMVTDLYTPARLLAYDTNTPYYAASFIHGFTFEDSMTAEYAHIAGNDVTIVSTVTYALV